MSDPVVKVARHTAAAFRLKDLGPIADMIDYLADQADKQWRADSTALSKCGECGGRLVLRFRCDDCGTAHG
jgi:hypothetical protein